MADFADRKCVPCEGGVMPLTIQEVEKNLKELVGWQLEPEDKITKEFHFRDFKNALLFVNKVGELAEKEGHHPDIELSWGYVKVILWTHAINGLHENDFILAAKIDEISI